MNSMVMYLLFIAAGILSAMHSGENAFSGPKGFFTWLAYTSIAAAIVIVLNNGRFK
jgi:hypothetical protein